MTTRALLVIDVQNEYAAGGALPITFPPFADSLRRIGEVMDAATAAGIPVVAVQQDMAAGSPAFAMGSEGWELHPVVASRQRALLVNKQLPGAFTGTELEQWLRATDIDTVSIVGYMTQHCVDSTARQAFHAGFAVEVLSDATGTLGYDNEAGAISAEQMHRVQLVALHAGLAAVTTTDDWLTAVRDGRALRMSNPVRSARQPSHA